MKMIRIAVKEPHKDWVIREVKDALPTYQKIVGGYIEGFYNLSGVSFFCNEEGKFKDLKFNFKFFGDWIMGNVFAVRSNEDGEFVSIEDEDLEICKRISNEKES